MREASIKLYRGVRNVNIVSNNFEFQRIILRGMFVTLALLALAYALILGNLILNIIQRKNLEKEAQALSTAVGELELTYLSVSGGIDLALSAQMGFTEAPANFATRQSLGSAGRERNEI